MKTNPSKTISSALMSFVLQVEEACLLLIADEPIQVPRGYRHRKSSIKKSYLKLIKLN